MYLGGDLVRRVVFEEKQNTNSLLFKMQINIAKKNQSIGLTYHPYDIATVYLSPTDDLTSHQSYVGLTIASVWHKVSYYIIRRT